MDERAAFLRAIQETPDDDNLRLVFADWLQEHGEDDRAEFIRVQVELHKQGPHTVKCSKPASRRHECCRIEGCDWCSLRRRERKLLRAHGRRWFPGFVTVDTAMFVVRRGFCEEATMDFGDWLAHGSEILARHPLTALHIRDKRPWEGRRSANEPAPNLWGWWRALGIGSDAVDESAPDTLPHELMLLVSNDPRAMSAGSTRYHAHLQIGCALFLHRVSAIDALVKACFAHGRTKGGAVAA